jgi:hypothetical protein
MPSDMVTVDASFLDTAPVRTQLEFPFTASPAEVFGAIAGDPAGWGAWFPGFGTDGHYTTPAPHGVGSVREVSVGGARMVDTIIAWEDGRRWAFCVSEGPLPGTRSLAEDYVMRPGADGGTLLTWTIAVEPDPDGGAPAAGNSLGEVFSTAFAQLDQHLAARRAAAGRPG